MVLNGCPLPVNSVAQCDNQRCYPLVALDPTGKPEKDLAAKYRQQAGEVENAGYYRFAGTLKKLADSYEHEGKRRRFGDG